MKIEKGDKWDWAYTLAYIVFATIVVVSVIKAYYPFFFNLTNSVFNLLI